MRARVFHAYTGSIFAPKAASFLAYIITLIPSRMAVSPYIIHSTDYYFFFFHFSPEK